MSKSGPFPEAVTGTALWTAAARARESVRPDALFSDPSAAALAGADGQARLVASEQASAGENPFLPVRTRFFDDLFTAATWAEQIVLLGAGMDTRAYRLNLPTDTVVFEVDHPDIFTPKNVVLDSVTPRCQRREVHPDLVGEWEVALMAAGFDAARLTGWLAEGLFFYLTEDAVHRLLRTAARLSRARALFGADIFGTGLLRLPSMQPLIHQRHGSNAYGAYFPARRAVGAEPLRRSSRLMVAGERSIPTAIALTPAPPDTGRRSVAAPPRTGTGPTVPGVSAGSDHRSPVAIYGQLLYSRRQPHWPPSTSNRRPSTPRTAPAYRSGPSSTTSTAPEIRTVLRRPIELADPPTVSVCESPSVG